MFGLSYQPTYQIKGDIPLSKTAYKNKIITRSMNIINVYDISSTHFLGFESEMELTVLDTTVEACDL